jgi:hypothetical protein
LRLAVHVFEGLVGILECGVWVSNEGIGSSRQRKAGVIVFTNGLDFFHSLI